MSRIFEVLEYLDNNGTQNTLEHFGISSGTLNHYKIKGRYNAGKKAKILLFDLETLPLLSYTWSTFKQNINQDQIVKDWCMLSWSAKWLYDSETFGDVLTPKEARERDDSRIMKGLWKAFEDCDVAIAHNAKKFDIKRMNTRFIMNGLKPPTPYQVIDTLEVARKWFAFSLNRLNYLGFLMKNHEKLATDFNLWKKCDQGDKESLGYMMEYNHQDVYLLEEVYLELRPWIKSHPNIAIMSEMEGECCVSCGSENIVQKGEYTTPAGVFNSYRCSDCGSISRGRKSQLTLKQKKSLLTSVAR